MKENFDIIESMFSEDPMKDNEGDPLNSSAVIKLNLNNWFLNRLKPIAFTDGKFYKEKKSQAWLREWHFLMGRREKLY